MKEWLREIYKHILDTKVPIGFRVASVFFLMGLLVVNIFPSILSPVTDLHQPQNIVSEEKENLKNKEEISKSRIIKILNLVKPRLKESQKFKLAEIIHKESDKYGYDPLLIIAIIRTESSFNNWAISNRGAKGLMQILPMTAEEIAKEANIDWKDDSTLHNPIVNIKMGTYYLSKLENIFKDIDLALEAYNRGPTKISRMIKQGKRPRKGYSTKVLSFYHTIKKNEI